MAWATSAAFQRALAAPIRYPVSVFTMRLNGDAQPAEDLTEFVTTWSLDRSPSDSAEQASRFAGSIAAKLTITLDSGLAAPGQAPTKIAGLSPFQASVASGWYRQDWGIGQRVTLATGFWVTPSAGTSTASGLETVPVFSGRVDNVSFDKDGVMTLVCLDDLVNLQADVDLPPVVVMDGDPDMLAYSTVEYVLRTGGMLRTPATPADSVPGTTLLSVPALFPEVGQLASPVRNGDDPGFLHLRAAPSYDTEYTSPVIYAPRFGSAVVFSGWLKSASSGADRGLLAIGDSAVGLWLRVLANGALWAGTLDGSRGISTAAGLMPNDNAWHHWQIEVWHTGGGGVELRSYRDGGALPTATGFGDLAVPDSQSGKILVGGLVHEGLLVRYLDFTKGDPAPTAPVTWTPTYSTDLRGVVATIRAIPRGSSGKALDLVRDVATGVGAVFRIREDGVWRWEERASWAARRVSAPVGTLTGDRNLLSSGISYSGASRRRSVTVDWTEYGTRKSTGAAPLWSATDIITVPMGETNLAIETEVAMASIFGVRITAAQDPRWSQAVVVPASQAGYSFAETITGRLLIRVRPTASGFQVRFVNNYSTPLALWDPVTGNPSFSLQGTAVVGGGSPLTYTAPASSRSREDLTLPASGWRQNRVQAMAMAYAIAAECSMSAVVFQDQVILSDPSLTVDDVVVAQTEPLTDGAGVPVQVVAMTTSDTESSATVRACYPPVGLVLGVAGRNTLPGLLAV